MTNRVVLVTGASSGIGLAIVKGLALTHRVVASSRSQQRLNQAILGISKAVPTDTIGSEVIDVTDSAAVATGVNNVVSHFGRIDILINCAGIGGGGVTDEMPEELWHRIIDTNLTGVYRVTTEVLRRAGMKERRWGRIVNIASTGGKQGVVFAAAYSASKHGVVGFTKSLGLELAKSGITVNAVCPGFVETPLAATARSNYARLWKCSEAEALDRITTRIPLGRYVMPDEVTGLVEYLASDSSASVLAQAFNVCGGLGNY
jgi:ketoreductase